MRFLLVAILFLGCSSLALADVESGPKTGDKVAPLKVYAVAGTVEDKEVDFVKDRKDEPTIYMFVNAEKFSRPMNKFMKTLDGKLGETSDKALSVIVWVGGDYAKNKEYIPKIQGSVKYEKAALAAFDGDANGPKDWGLNSAAHLTVVVVNAGKVVKSFAYESVNDTDVKDVLEVLKKATAKK